MFKLNQSIIWGLSKKLRTTATFISYIPLLVSSFDLVGGQVLLVYKDASVYNIFIIYKIFDLVLLN